MTKSSVVRAVLLGTAITLLAREDGGAQLDRPGAFSRFSGCGHYSCVWIPSLDAGTVDPPFHRGGFTYAVDSSGHFVLRRLEGTVLRTPLKDLSASVSVTWAPSTDAFAITWSDGGAIGGFHVRAFRIDGGKAIEMPAINAAVADFKLRHYCKDRGNNVQAYRWINGGDELLLETSVYNTSDCGRDMGYFEGYVVRAQDGAILKHYSRAEWIAYMRRFPE